MTVTEEKPEVGALVAATDAGEEAPPPRPAPRGVAGALGTADHKVVGRLYLAVALVLLGASLVLAVLVGVEGMDLGSLNVLSSETFFQIYTLSRVGIVFLGLLPALLGLAIYVVPLQVGASAVAFPRTAAASFWGWLLGSGLLVGGYAINGGPGGGRVEGVLLSYAAWIMVIISLLAGVVCVVTTVLSLRPRVAIVGTVFASVAVSMVILSLVGIYLARRADVVNSGGAWIPRGANIPLPQPTMILITLVISGFTILWAAHALRIDDRSNAYVALGITLLLGFAAFNQATYLISGLNVAVATESGLLILTISGLWLAWLLTALVYLTLMAFRALGGQYRRIPDGIEAAAFYWISNTAVWSVLWIAIYIIK